ncbi:MAG: lytic murein transglycosylase B [Methylococcaceae bacterium]|jgi:membrane-bound lytic murein transglycosylase B
MNRRFKYQALLSLITLGLASCASEPSHTKAPPPAANKSRAVQIAPVLSEPLAQLPSYGAQRISGDYAGYPALNQFIDGMVSQHGFSREYLNAVFSKAKRKQWTLDYLSKETGSAGGGPRPGAWSRYRAQFLTELHINSGAEFWRQHADSLQRASKKYGVPPEYILGIMGVETVFGRNVGKHRVIDALTTLAFDYPRRGSYFAGELEKFLLMVRAEKIDPLTPEGSYAGAMGLGQFMPSSFLQWAVDFNGDGARNLWQADDVIGSIANYFAEHGWHHDEAVVTPALATGTQIEDLEVGFDSHYDIYKLNQLGIKATAQLPSPNDIHLLRLRASQGDQYWLGHHNFYVITRYNHSTHYAMAVHELAQAIKQRYLANIAAR